MGEIGGVGIACCCCCCWGLERERLREKRETSSSCGFGFGGVREGGTTRVVLAHFSPLAGGGKGEREYWGVEYLAVDGLVVGHPGEALAIWTAGGEELHVLIFRRGVT